MRHSVQELNEEHPNVNPKHLVESDNESLLHSDMQYSSEEEESVGPNENMVSFQNGFSSLVFQKHRMDRQMAEPGTTTNRMSSVDELAHTEDKEYLTVEESRKYGKSKKDR
jgi:hypothetical protein